MSKISQHKFNHLKIHTQYSICEGAIKIDSLKNFCKERKVQSVGLSDTSNLCGALEFAESISKAGTQPIIGTQINFKLEDTIGLISLIALNEKGYKKIIELSSKSYLENNTHLGTHVDITDLYKNGEGLLILSGSIQGLFGKLFDKGRFSQIQQVYQEFLSTYADRFYLEIQRHGDQNEKSFEKYNLQQSHDLKIPIIATNEVFYLDKEMHEAHDAYLCVGEKTYVNVKDRRKYSNEHYLKTSEEMYMTLIHI